MIRYTPPSPDFELRRRNRRVYACESTLGQVFATAGVTSSVAPPLLRLATGAGANRVHCRGENAMTSVGIDPYFLADGLVGWDRPWRVSAFIFPFESSANPTATQFAGLGIDFYGVAAPWPVTHANPVIQLRARNDTGAVELLIQKGDGVTNESVTTLTGVTVTAGCFQKYEIEYNPGESVRAYLDGVLGAEVTAGLPTVPGSLMQFAGVNVFVHSGTNAAGSNQSYFHLITAETFR